MKDPSEGDVFPLQIVFSKLGLARKTRKFTLVSGEKLLFCSEIVFEKLQLGL